MLRSKKSLWAIILQVSLATMLIVGGLTVFVQAGRFEFLLESEDLLVSAVGNLFSHGALRDGIMYVLAIVEIITGVLLLLDFFNIKSLNKVDTIFLAIIMLCWVIVFVVLGTIIPFIRGHLAFLPFLRALSKNVLMVSAMGSIKVSI
ncbi:MAG TPA: hypothetical protein VFC68_07615 [Treponemataceae bacterium]|nr:hypothetical protein [Treponemataceae bacterium]